MEENKKKGLMPQLWLRVFLVAGTLELLSLATFYVQELRPVMMTLLGITALLLAIKDMRWLFGLLVIEMVIGSHGHLFSAQVMGHVLTIRMLLFGTLTAAWIIHVLRGCSRIFHFSHMRITGPLLFIIGAVAWGMLRAWSNGISPAYAIGDANGYVFLALIPIAIEQISDRRSFAWIGRIFVGALTWLAFKSLLLLYLFSHEFPFLKELYTWQRKAWLTEITRLDGGVYRVFAASDIFLLIGVFVGFMLLWKMASKRKWVWMSLISSAFLLSLSRSFWLGGLVAITFTFPVLARLKMLTLRSVKGFLLKGIGILTVSAAVLLGIMQFPFPNKLSDASAIAVFSSKLTGISDAAVSSRWNMLGPLTEKIKEAPILGSGFGTAITYRSDDPRIHALHPGGIITTYAIEWQYLEMIMKMGILGILGILWLWLRIGVFFWRAIKNAAGKDLLLVIGLMMAFFAFIIANIFTPYLNHPLGWMFLALTLDGLHASAEDNYENPTEHLLA